MSLGTELRRLRKGQRLTLTQVSDMTGLSVSFLSDIELGKTKPSLDNLEKLASFYQISINDVLHESNFGGSALRAYPPGYKEFLDEMQDKIDPEMEDLLLRLEHRAKRRTETKEDWMQLYYSLKAILGR